MPLTAEDIKAAAARRRRTLDIDVPEFGVVRLRALSAGDVVRLQSDTKKAELEGREREEVAFDYLARSWIGESGDLLFPLEEGVQVAKSLDTVTYATLVRAVLKLNGMDAEAIEDAGKN